MTYGNMLAALEFGREAYPFSFSCVMILLCNL